MRCYRAIGYGTHTVHPRYHSSIVSNVRASEGFEFPPVCPAMSGEQQAPTPKGISNQGSESHNRKSKTTSEQLCMLHQIPCGMRNPRWAKATKVPTVLP